VPEEAVTLAPSADNHDVSLNMNPVQRMTEEDDTPSTSGTPSSSASQVTVPSSSFHTPNISPTQSCFYYTSELQSCQHKAKVANLQRANKRPKEK